MRFDKEPGGRGLSGVAERLSSTQYELAHSRVERKKVNMRDPEFVGHYGEQSIADDLAYVAKRKASFALEAQERTRDGMTKGEIVRASECAEYVIMEGIDRGWFRDCTVTKTSDLDDIRNGIDCLVERRKGYGPASHLGLAIDVTCAKSMEEKLAKIKSGIDAGQLSEIKYFKTKSQIGGLRNLPKVVAAIDPAAIEKLMREMNQGGDIKTHTLRLTLIKQFEMQLDAFYAYAKKVHPELSEHFGTARETVRAMSTELEADMKKYSYILDEHPTLASMKESLTSLFTNARPQNDAASSRPRILPAL